MTRRAPATLACQPVVITVHGGDSKITVSTTNSTTTITTSASKRDESHGHHEVDASSSTTHEDNTTALDHTCEDSKTTSAKQDGEKEVDKSPLAQVSKQSSHTETISQPGACRSTVTTSARFELMTSTDYRNEGLLPILSLIRRKRSAPVEDTLYRVYAIGFQRLDEKSGYEFVIHCDTFTFREATFLNMPSVLLQRSTHPLDSVGDLAIRAWDRPASSNIGNVMSMGMPLVITCLEMTARGCHDVGDRQINKFALHITEATAAWEEEYLSNASGEEIVERATGLEVHVIREIIAKRMEARFDPGVQMTKA